MSELITDDMLEQFCTIGTYDELVPKLLKHYGGLTTRAAFAIPARTPEEERDAQVDDQGTAGGVAGAAGAAPASAADAEVSGGSSQKDSSTCMPRTSEWPE